MEVTTQVNRRAWEAASQKHVREYEALLAQAASGSSLLDTERDLLREVLRASPDGRPDICSSTRNIPRSRCGPGTRTSRASERTAATSPRATSTTPSRLAEQSNGSEHSARSSRRCQLPACRSCISASIRSRSGGWVASTLRPGPAGYRMPSRSSLAVGKRRVRCCLDDHMGSHSGTRPIVVVTGRCRRRTG